MPARRPNGHDPDADLTRLRALPPAAGDEMPPPPAGAGGRPRRGGTSPPEEAPYGDRTGDGPGSRTDDLVRRVRLTPASAIVMRPVRWLWEDRIPAGAITLIPGREGIGKSLALAWLAARLTRGQLPGQHHGQPRPVIYAATEDSWAHTIGPRLYAAGADLDMVYRADVDQGDGRIGQLSLPVDCVELAAEITRRGVALLAADPLLSLIGSHIDSHRDRELRTALEPLAALADATGCAVAGLAHFNKSASDDALNLITGSRAFSAVARAVIAIARDPAADDGTCIMSQAKNNLGRLDLPSLSYVVRTADVPTPEGPASVGVLELTGETTRHVTDILAEHTDDPDERAERDEAAGWLISYLTTQGGEASSSDVLKAAQADGFAKRTMQRARRRAGVSSRAEGFPRRTIWRLDPQSRQWRQSCRSSGGGATVAPLEPSHEAPPDASPPAVLDTYAPAPESSRRATAERDGPAGLDADALFDAAEDVVAAAHPTTAAGGALPDTLTTAVEDLADTLNDASGTGPHDELITAARRVLAAAVGIQADPRTHTALAALRHTLPAPVAPQSRQSPRPGTTGATGATGATAHRPSCNSHAADPVDILAKETDSA
jgi:hypothetical protein